MQDCPADDGEVSFRDVQCKSHGDKWSALDEGSYLSVVCVWVVEDCTMGV